MNNKKPLVRLTKKDFRFDYFSGSGGGGQNRNKVKNCVRIHHDPSGAMAVCQDHRDRPANERDAFKRICASKEFKTWIKIESLKAMGKEETIEQAVERQMREAIVEVKDENGNWVKDED